MTTTTVPPSAIDYATADNNDNLHRVLKVLKDQEPRIDGTYPVIWHLDVTGRCNLSCLYCQRDFYMKTEHSFIKEDMSDATFDALVPYFKHARLVALLSMLGEPLLVKSLPRWWNAILEAGAKPQTTTNGILLTEKLADMFTGAGGRLKISIDSFEQDTLTILRPKPGGRRGATPEMFREKLDMIERYRRIHRNERFQLGVNLVMTSRNLPHAVATMEECLRHTRVDVFTLASFRMPMDEKGTYHADAEQLSVVFEADSTRKAWTEIIEWATKKGKEDGIQFVFPWSRSEWAKLLGRRPDGLSDGSFEETDTDFDANGADSSDYHCCVPWMKVGVLADGAVIPCHLLYWPSPELSFGNLGAQSFDEIWHGDKYVEFRRNMAERKNLGACMTCKSWWRWYAPQRTD